MSPEVLSLLVLVGILLIATLLPIDMGVLGFGAAFLVGAVVLGLSTDEVLAGFPADLVVTLVGITYLFGIAQVNGTVDLLVAGAVRAVGGRVGLVPWVMFAVSAVLVGIGALFAVAIVAPIALRFAARHRIDPLYMGMMVVHGALGGAFTPISVYGSFVDGLVRDGDLASSPLTLTLAPLGVNLAIAAALTVWLGRRRVPAVDPGMEPAGVRAGVGPAAAEPAPDEPDTPSRVSFVQVATLAGILLLATLTVVWSVDVGFASLLIGAGLALLDPRGTRRAVDSVAWSTVLLIAGVLTYVGVLQAAGTIDLVSNAIAGLGVTQLAALLICYLGGIASAFASSVAMVGVMVPLALPFLQQGDIGPIGFVAALAVATTVVDVSPFSTNGALVLANAPAGTDRERFYKRMLGYAGAVTVLGPLLAWAVFVLPGWG
ncbi:MAG: hypothetical protein JWQ53_113 [Klenkia sp.]|nr:hypothetical protein [Klenkia sp.]